MLAQSSLLTYSKSACINGTALPRRHKTGVVRRGSNHLRTCPPSTVMKIGFMPTDAKVKLAKLVVDVLPGEVGLRLLVNIFPEKIQVVFDGLLNSYKVQYLEHTNV